MEEAAPAPPIGGSWHTSKTVWASIFSFLLILPSLIDPIVPFLTDEQRQVALAVAAIAGTLASLFARKGGVDAAKAVVDVQVEAQAGKLLPGVLRALGERMDERADEDRAERHPETLPTHARRPPRSSDTGRFDG